MKNRISFLLPGIIIASFVIAGCGSGGGSSGSSGVGTGTGLSVPSQMSVVQPTGAGGSGKPSKAKSRMAVGLVGAQIASDSAYMTDPVNIFVHDDSMEPLENVNNILCMVAQTRYADMVNQGNYLAQVDNKKCEQGSNQSSQGSDAGQSTGAQADQLELWTVNSSRADDASPEILKAWIDEPANGDQPAKLIYAKMIVTEGISDANPFGKFTMSFKALDPSAPASSTDATFTGTLRTVDRDDGKLEYAFYMDEGDLTTAKSVGERASRSESRVVTMGDGSTGEAYMSMEERYNWGDGDTSLDAIYNVAYDAGHFRRSPDGGTTNACLDRSAFDTKAWRYGLYNASDGSRVSLNSGFSIRTSSGAYGWVGYWGLWVQDDVTLNTGDTVTKMLPGSSASGGTYTIFRAPGKLVKHTKQTLTLGDLIGESLNYWDMTGNYRVSWDGTDLSEVFKWNDATMAWDSYGPVSLNSTFSANQYIGFYGESLGGSVSLIWPSDATPTNSTPIVFYLTEIMNGSSSLLASGNVTFNCYYGCLRANITQDQADYNGDSPFLTDSSDVSSPNTYVFVASTMTLTLDGASSTKIGVASGVVPSASSPNYWGFMGGAMVPSGTTITNPWDIWNADVFYTWETGPNQWNQFSGVKDGSGNFVSFDPPLFMTYTHHDSSDPAHDGHIYQLDYSGFGELHGIPFEDAGNGRWYPVITIPDGTLLGDSSQYIVKALEKEQKMQEVDDGNCSALDTSNGLTAPQKNYSDPAIGSKPTVDAAPAVIKGLLASEL